jgi:hypothetical protein
MSLFQFKAKCNYYYNTLSFCFPVRGHTGKMSSSLLPRHYGVLILNGGQTYGRLKNKLLYKCVPEDKSLPRVVLVPYHDHDKVQFSKDRVNKFITFTFNDNPVSGTLRSVLGQTDVAEDYLQYRLQSQHLAVTSLKSFLQALKPCGLVYPSSYLLQGIEDRSKLEVYSIDPVGCQDIDDALGLQGYDPGSISGMVTVYIANVPLLLDRLNLWAHLSERTSTIYLPDDKKIPMLPPLLSDNWCSLKAQEERLAFAMDVLLVHGRIIDVSVKPVVVKVNKNCAYDDLVMPELIEKLLQLTIQMNQSYPFLGEDMTLLNKEDQMHKLVEYWMVFMNSECAKILVQKQTGLFRKGALPPNPQEAQQGTLPPNPQEAQQGALPPNPQEAQQGALPPNPQEAQQGALQGSLPSCYHHLLNNHSSPEYFRWKESGAEPFGAKPHGALPSEASPPGGWGAEPPSYTHITSPIRRIVDLLNMTFLQEEFISDQGKAVATQWLMKVDYINQQTKATKKIQNEALLLSLYKQDNTKVYEGCVMEMDYDATPNNDLIKYSVYIAELKLWSSFKTRQVGIAPYTLRQFTLFVFLNETKLTRKIRLQLVL